MNKLGLSLKKSKIDYNFNTLPICVAHMNGSEKFYNPDPRSSRTHLHDGDSSEGDARPVEGPDADAAGDDGTQTLDQLVRGLQDGDEPSSRRKLDDVRCATLGTLDLQNEWHKLLSHTSRRLFLWPWS